MLSQKYIKWRSRGSSHCLKWQVAQDSSKGADTDDENKMQESCGW